MTDKMFTETPIIRSVKIVEDLPPEPKQPRILRIKAETELGPLDLPITQLAAQELAALLATHPLTRGSA